MLYRREGFPNEDELVLCTVTKVLNNAVFVNLDEYDKGGLIHISEVAPGRIRNIREYVELGKKVVCKVLNVNTEKGHIDLSLRRVSEIERKKKLDDIKQEQKAEKVIEIASQQLNEKPNTVYEIVSAKAFERYPFIYLFFKDIAANKIQAKELINDEKVAILLQGIVQERFKPQNVAIKGTFNIKCFEPEGVEVIKNAILEINKKKKNALVETTYIGGGKYKIKVESANYKDAESTLEQIEKQIEKSITNGEVLFTREEA